MDAASATLFGQLSEMARELLLQREGVALVYGSHAYGISTGTSDIDVVVIADGVDSSARNRFIRNLVSLHHEHRLPLDDEVPFDRKVIASLQDAESAVTASFLPLVAGRRQISPIIKTTDFLSSEEMRLRLLLNALTGRCVPLAGAARTLAKLQTRARRCWLTLLPELAPLPQTWTVTDFVDALIGTPPVDGEMFLGFKSHPIVREYLLASFAVEAHICVADGLLCRAGSGYCLR